jgi:hypothetical protein
VYNISSMWGVDLPEWSGLAIEVKNAPVPAILPLPLPDILLALVLLGCLLDSLTGRIPHAEPGDLCAIFPAQYYHTGDAHQIQAITLAQKRLLTFIVHRLTLYTW